MVPKESTKIKELRAVTEVFGAVHEEQLLQLRTWPAVVFSHPGWFGTAKGAPTDASAAVDPENKIVAYKVQWTKGTSTGKKAHAIRVADTERLVTWVRTLLGANWSVVVELMIGDKQDHLYESLVPDAPARVDPLEIGRNSWRPRLKAPSSSAPSPTSPTGTGPPTS